MQEVLEGIVGRRTAVLHGLGGIGKTQLAIAYARRRRDNYSTAIWFNAKDETTLKQSFARTAESILRQDPSLTYLSTAVGNQDLESIVEAVKRWLEEPMNDQWLLLYDNYDNPPLTSDTAGKGIVRPLEGNDPKGEARSHKEDAKSKAFSIHPYLPGADHGAIIVTTRSSAVKLGQSIKLGKLEDISDSLEILTLTSGRESFMQGEALSNSRYE